MAKKYLGMRARWWVTPFMLCCKVAIYARLLKGNRMKTVARFIADHGFKFITR